MSYIKILTWVEPTGKFISQIKKDYPTKQIEIIKRQRIDISIFRFIRIQNRLGIEGFYILCRDLNYCGRLPYFLVLTLISNAKIKKIIDLNNNIQDSSWTALFFIGIPRILLEIPWSLSVFIFTWAILNLLNNRFIIKFLQIIPQYSINTERELLPKCIGFFWSAFPDSNFDFTIGGEVSHVVGFLSGLKKKGYKVFLVSSRPIFQKRFNVYNEIIYESKLPQWPGEIKQMAYNWRVLRKAKNVIQQNNPSFIYHRTTGFSYIGVLLSIRYRIPLLIEINSSEIWKAENWSGVRFKNILKLTEQLCLTYASKVIVVSEYVCEYFLKQGIPLNKIIVNPNGVDPDLFSSRRNGNEIRMEYNLSEKIVVGFVGTFNRHHGIITLAQAIKFVIEEDNNINFLIIGEGILRSDFERLIARDNVAHYVTLTGKVSPETVPNFLDSCDILVSPHQNMEDGSTFFGSPIKIFEYMAMSKGIVASRVGQLEQILQHEVTALLVEPEDPQALARGILRLAQDSVLRQNMGQKAREHVIKYYTWEKNVERVMRQIFQ